MIVMLFDTETSGLPRWNLPSQDPSQPHICQYTAALFDDSTGEELEYVDQIYRQEWPVDIDAFRVHQITPERSLEDGVPEEYVVKNFLAMLNACDRVTGFSLDFDIRMMRIAMLRFGRSKPDCDVVADRCKATKYDVMRKCTPLCKVPPSEKMMATGRKTFKQPSLKEAIEALFGEVMDDAHDARGDVLATKRIYMHLKALGLT